MSADAYKIAKHIRERISKSGSDSPSVNISRDGWALILRLLEKHVQEIAAAKPGHKLKTLNGAVIATWKLWPEWTEIQGEVAVWADCSPDDVAVIETPAGEFITAEGTPVAFMERAPAVSVQAAE